MAHWKKSFPGKFLQVSDLDTPLIATIASAKNENRGMGENAELYRVLHFAEPGMKSVVLNLTRSESVEAIVGNPDTDRWPGHRVKLFKGTTRYAGRKVDCIAIGPAPARDDIDETMQSLTSEVL